MKKLRIKSNLSLDDVRVMYNAAVIHAELDHNFGLFCLGIAVSLRSIFIDLQETNPRTLVNVNTLEAIAGTITLLDGFDGGIRDLRTAEANEITNKELSIEILGLAKDAIEKRNKTGM